MRAARVGKKSGRDFYNLGSTERAFAVPEGPLGADFRTCNRSAKWIHIKHREPIIAAAPESNSFSQAAYSFVTEIIAIDSNRIAYDQGPFSRPPMG